MLQTSHKACHFTSDIWRWVLGHRLTFRIRWKLVAVTQLLTSACNLQSSILPKIVSLLQQGSYTCVTDTCTCKANVSTVWWQYWWSCQAKVYEVWLYSIRFYPLLPRIHSERQRLDFTCLSEVVPRPITSPVWIIKSATIPADNENFFILISRVLVLNIEIIQTGLGGVSHSAQVLQGDVKQVGMCKQFWIICILFLYALLFS